MEVSAFTHFIAFVALLGRLADVLSTRVVSPRLTLEANPVVRRVGWVGAWATLLPALVAYVNAPMGVVIAVTSFLVAASNLFRGWVVRFLGESEVDALLIAAVRKGRLGTGIGFVCSAGACAAAAGALTMVLSGPTEWGYYSGFGIVVYGAAMAIHGSSNLRRLFRRAGVPAV
jgi:hypothetical protein